MKLMPESDTGLRSLDIFLGRKGSDGGFSAGEQHAPICPLWGPPDGYVKGGFKGKV